MTLDFPNISPSVNQRETLSNGVLYVYDGQAWNGETAETSSGTTTTTVGDNITQVTNNITEVTNVFEATPADLGAKIAWDDQKLGPLTDDSDTRFRKFRDLVDEGKENSLFVPGGTEIILRQEISFSNKFGLVGPEAALGKDLPKIIFKATGNWNTTYGIVALGGMRARNFQFKGTGKESGSRSNQPNTLIYVGENKASNNQDDIDSSFKNCEFSLKREGTVIVFNGRNVNVGNCNFSDSKKATLLHLKWDNIQVDTENNGDAFVTTSWRKNRIYNNQFHVNDNCDCIVTEGDYPICGLAVTDNIIDTGPRLLVIRSGGVNGGILSGNVWYGRNNDEQGVVRFGGGIIHGLAITGNTFSAFHVDVIDTRDNENVTQRPTTFIYATNAVSINALAITGNTFSFSEGGAINIQNNSDQERVAVTGNVFANCFNDFPNRCVNAGNMTYSNN